MKISFSLSILLISLNSNFLTKNVGHLPFRPHLLCPLSHSSEVPGSKQRKCYHCIHDLFLCSQFPQQQHTTINIYYLCFCGSGTLEWLSHMVLAQGVSLGCRHDSSQVFIIWRLGWGWRITFQDGSLGVGKNPYNVASGFPQRESGPQRSKEEVTMPEAHPPTTFSLLRSFVTKSACARGGELDLIF